MPIDRAMFGERVQLAIIIVNYRTPEMVADCLSSVLPEISELNCRVIVVDNESGDDSPARISAWMATRSPSERAQMMLVNSGYNGGFSFGNNIGLAQVSADYYLLLNSDTLLRTGSIKILLETAALHPKFGLIGPRLEYLDGSAQESCFRRHTAISELIRGSNLTIVSRVFKKSVVHLAVDDHTSEIEWLSFACVLIRGEVLNQIGALDEGYFMYFEDAEFCRRAKKAGWELHYCPRAKVVHLRGGTSPVKKCWAQRARLPRYYYESRARYFRQHGGVVYLCMANVLWLAGRVLCFLKRFFGKKDNGTAYLEWRDLWIGSGTLTMPGQKNLSGEG